MRNACTFLVAACSFVAATAPAEAQVVPDIEIVAPSSIELHPGDNGKPAKVTVTIRNNGPAIAKPLTFRFVGNEQLAARSTTGACQAG